MSLCLVLRQDKGRDPPAAVPARGHATALLRQIWNSVCPAWNVRYTWTLQQAERLKTNSYAGQGRLPCSQGKRRVFSPFYINYKLGQLPWDSIPNRDAARKSNQLKLLPCETDKFSCLQGKFPSCCRQQPHCDWNFSAFLQWTQITPEVQFLLNLTGILLFMQVPLCLTKQINFYIFLLLNCSVVPKSSPSTQFLPLRHYTITWRGTTFISNNCSQNRHCRQMAENRDRQREFTCPRSKAELVIQSFYSYSITQTTRQKCLPSLLSHQFLSIL